MARTGIVQDDSFLRHDTGPMHPECPDRLRAVFRAIKTAGFADALAPIPAKALDAHWARRVHSESYLARLRTACDTGAAYIDEPDSAICPESASIAYKAAGSVLNGVDAIMAGQVRNVFCPVRPPGHHCEFDRSMGFCLLNNVAIAARYLQEHHRIRRILILDWDVHHGNGTQHAFEEDSSVFYCSFHEHPDYRYPGTGYAEEIGKWKGRGATLNIPFLPGSTDADYQRAYEEKFRSVAEAFQPEFILVSAGFDAHTADPLATIDLTAAGFSWLSRNTVALADRLCDGHLLTILEGGYNLHGLAEGVVVHLAALLDRPPPVPPTGETVV